MDSKKIKHDIIFLLTTNICLLLTCPCSLDTFNPLVYIKANRNRCMNLKEGLGVTTIYRKGKEGWLRRERESLHKKDKLCSSVVT
jgi:hypothetical protein